MTHHETTTTLELSVFYSDGKCNAHRAHISNAETETQKKKIKKKTHMKRHDKTKKLIGNRSYIIFYVNDINCLRFKEQKKELKSRIAINMVLVSGLFQLMSHYHRVDIN